MQTSLNPVDPPQRVSRLTRLFPAVLGLRLLPFGLWFLLAAASGAGVAPPSLHFSMLPLALLATWLVHRLYRRRFGTVERERLPLGRNWAILGCLAAAYLALRLFSVETDPLRLLQILVVLLFFTAVLLFLPTLGQGLAVVAIFVGLTVFLALPLLLFVTGSQEPGYGGAVFSFCLGLVLTAAGIVDHVLLVRSLGRIGDESRA